MKRSLLALLALAALSPLPARAQGTDAYVAPVGTLRLGAGMTYFSYDSRFTASGEEAPLLAGLSSAALDAGSFAPLRESGQLMEQLLGRPVTAEEYTLGMPELRVFRSGVRAPLELGLGVLPRLELTARLPLLFGNGLVERLGFPTATLGLNPDPGANAAAFETLGAEYAPLGRLPFLPTAGSELGQALQAAANNTLSLPDSSLAALPRDSAALAGLDQLLLGTYGLQALAAEPDRWRPGDLELGARVQLVNTLGALPLPADSAGLNVRVSAWGSVRLPTGREPDTLSLAPMVEEVGLSGYRAGGSADLFWGPRFWVSASAGLEHLGAVEVRRWVAPPAALLSDTALARTVRWSPGPRLAVRLIPRFRLAEALALGLELDWERRGESRFAEVGGAWRASSPRRC